MGIPCVIQQECLIVALDLFVIRGIIQSNNKGSFITGTLDDRRYRRGCAAHIYPEYVITSYSIHYTKLYEGHDPGAAQ